VQNLMRRTIAEVAGYPEDDIHVGVDGCGVSVFALPLLNMARAYARLASPDAFPEPRRRAARMAMEAVAQNPFMIAGTGRLCTDLVEATQGRIIGKEGADGVYCLAVRDRGVGFAFKVEDGHSRVMGPVIVSALLQMGMLSEREVCALRDWRSPGLTNHRGESVGYLEAVFELHKACSG
ncbi:MAG: asparaginase, partial [Bacillota bacterium]